jgi:hypothetical protein
MHTLYEEEEEKALSPYFYMNTIPRKIPELEAYREELYLMVQDRLSPLVNAVITFARGAMARVYSGQQAEMDLVTIQTA